MIRNSKSRTSLCRIATSNRECHVILLTAKGQEYDRQRGIEAGADCYMTKPFDSDQLLEMACEILGIEA